MKQKLKGCWSNYTSLQQLIELDCPETALGKFLAENNHYEFYGSLKNCDAKTHGKKGATYRDQNENQTIEIDIIE